MRQKHEPIPWKRGLIAILAALAVSALCCGLLSLLTLGEKIPLEGAKTAAPILSALSLFAACYYTVRPQRQQKLLIALGMGTVYVAGALSPAPVGGASGGGDAGSAPGCPGCGRCGGRTFSQQSAAPHEKVKEYRHFA